MTVRRTISTVSTGDGSSRRSPARRGEGERLRGEIVDAALRLLAETGNTATLSLRAVAREVGVAATSIYLHFPDIDALLLEVKTQLSERLARTECMAADAAGPDPFDRLLAMAHGYVRFGIEEPGLYHVIFSSPTLSPKYLQMGSYIGREAFERVRQEVAALVGEQTSHLVTTHFWTALHGLVVLRTTRTRFPWPELDTEVEDLTRRLVGRT
jgi:AcrR family transcriptional regulator